MQQHREPEPVLDRVTGTLFHVMRTVLVGLHFILPFMFVALAVAMAGLALYAVFEASVIIGCLSVAFVVSLYFIGRTNTAQECASKQSSQRYYY